MSTTGPTSQPPGGTAPPPSPAIERANRMSAANMVRSLAPLVLICLLIAGWVAFQQGPDARVRTVDPTSSVQLAAARASYPLPVPGDLPEGYRPTSVRTDAGAAGEGDPVTLAIGYLTPGGEYAGFAVSDDPRASALTDVLGDAEQEGSTDVDGEAWTRWTTARGETALSREADGATVVVTGSASDGELVEVAAAVEQVAP
ncbi:DUF4245 domain-containing protein [Geodermatophilus marinus]|uniref:DUF4245 domain-containing protein n=1 Tax=Geodermatophilus sp. LHW52908 TaxID=2303986 RepID=UPI000E3C2998|nr:DUF4245 domain-containing protein [Geodermatophilus sp. LHW52908]RFU22897.1 DUF4245 domain-containing protein [Geodermatophilus sp. LHW52908]